MDYGAEVTAPGHGNHGLAVGYVSGDERHAVWKWHLRCGVGGHPVESYCLDIAVDQLPGQPAADVACTAGDQNRHAWTSWCLAGEPTNYTASRRIVTFLTYHEHASNYSLRGQAFVPR